MIRNEKPKLESAEHQKVEALLDGQRRVLEMVVTQAPLAESLDALVRLIEAQIPGMLASVLLLDKEGIHLRHGAAPSLPPEYVKAIDGGAIGPAAGSCGTAAYYKDAVYVDDISTDPRWEKYRAFALPYGIRACWSTPILDGHHQVLGTFALYYRQPALPKEEHLRLIAMATHIASLAICSHRTHAELQESEATLKEAQRLAKIGYWNRDLVADRITWSDETWRIFGLRPQDRTLTQAELQSMIHPDDRERQRLALAETITTHRPYDLEFRIVRPDREVRFVHVRDAIVYDASHRPIRIFGSVQDITERRQAEDALRESRHLLQSVLATLPVGVSVTDRAGNIVLTNAAAERIWGGAIIPGQERWERSKGWWHESGQEIAPENWASVRALAHEETSLNELIDIVTFNGQKKTIENSAAPVRNAEGVLVGALIINEDVTEKIRAEELLQARQQEIRAIVENSPDFIVRYDLELRRTYVNPAFTKAQGVSGEELLGREVGTKAGDGLPNVTSEELAVLKTSLEWVRDHRQRMNLEHTWPLSTGRRDFSVHLEPEFDVRGVFTSILAISRDVTELKAAEKRLRQMEAELARVSRLTTMGELAVAIAHETNQPLSAVATNAEACLNWLDAQPPNFGEVREALRRIVRDGTRAGQVITRIRSLLNKGAPVRSAVDISDVIEETLGFVQADIERNKVRVKTELKTNPPKVHADRVQVQQVLLNLLANAIDALKSVSEAARTLCVRTTQNEPTSVQVTVQDSGPGIDPAQAVHLFDAFFTTKTHGLGMGLAISRSIIEAHGGRLWSTPNDGPGASFHFTLPVDRG